MRNSRNTHLSFCDVYAKPLLIGSLSSIIVSSLLLFLTALLISKGGNIPYEFMEIIMIFISTLGSFVGGLASGKFSKSNGWLSGLLCGIILFFIFFICGLIVTHSSLTLVTLTRGITIILAGTIGGIAGISKN